MKRISLLKIMAFGVLALVHTACENAKYDVIDNLVYINEASTSKIKIRLPARTLGALYAQRRVLR